MAITKFDLVTQASSLIGGTTISTFIGDDLSAEAEVASLIYDQTKEKLLSGYFWNFATTEFQGNRNPDAPINKNWRFSFALPIDSAEITDVIATNSGTPVDFRQFNNEIFTNTKDVIVRYR